MLGLIGVAALSFGVFAPFLRLPIIGSVNYFQNGKGDGVVILVLAATSLVLVLTKFFVGLWFTGVGSLGILGFTFINLQVRLAEVARDMQANDDNMFAPLGQAMLDSVSIDWGFAVLLIGSALVIAAAAIPLKGHA